MKILTPIGSKERFLEIFEGVTKVKINEVATNIMQTGTQLVERAFEELKTGVAKVNRTNTQTVGEDNFVEIITNDNEGNEITFKFKVNSNEGDQDGVYNMNNAILSEFKIKSQTLNVDMPENMQAVKDFNANHGSEIMDVVGEYANFETNSATADNDEVYEEAIKLIDKVPYKKGTEQMQTNKAYADQKPTNPDVRVKSDELNKFVSEDANSILHYSQAARDAGGLYPKAKSMSVTNQYVLRDTLGEIDIDIINIVDIGDKYQITFEYNGKTQSAKLKKNYGSAAKVRDLLKKKIGITENEEHQDDDYIQNMPIEDPLADPTDYSDSDTPILDDPDADDGTKGIDPFDQIMSDSENEPLEVLSPEKIAIIHQANDNLIAAGNNAPTMVQIMAEINKLEGIKPPEKTRGIPKGAEAFWENKSISTDLKPHDILKQSYEKLLTPDKKRELIFKAQILVDEELGELKNILPTDKYTKAIKDEALRLFRDDSMDMNEEAEKSEYPDQIGKKFKPKNQMPKKKKKPQAVVKLSEESEIPQEYWGKPENEMNEEPDQSVDEFLPITTPLGSQDDKLFISVVNQGIDSHLEGFTKSKFETRDGRRIFNFNKSELPLLLRRLQELGTEEALSWKDDIENYDKTLHEEDEKPEPAIEPDFDAMGMGQDDGMSLEPEADQIEQLSQEKEETGDMLAGGLADDKVAGEFDPEQLTMGLKVEMEHTDNPMIALEIAMDHLAEISDYYTHLDKMEKEAGVEEPEGDESIEDTDSVETDELLGYKPHNVSDYTDEEFDYAASEREYANKEDMEQNPQDFEDNVNWKEFYQMAKSTDGYNPEFEQKYGNLLSKPHISDAISRSNDFNTFINIIKDFETITEEQDFEEYQGQIGDRYQDAENNQFTVRDKVKGGVTLQGQGGEKEIGTNDLQFLKKLSEEEVVEMARQALNKRGLNEGMTKKEAVQILIKHNIK